MSQSIYKLTGRVGEYWITNTMAHIVSSAKMEELETELEKIAIRDGLAVEIESLGNRGHRIRWWPADEQYPW